MNTLVRVCALALTLILLAGSLAGCHGKVERPSFTHPTTNATTAPSPSSPDGTPTPESPWTLDETQRIEISFWAKNDSNQTQINIYKQAIASFEALYPNIKVNFKAYSDYGQIYNDVITNIATNTTPNVCITYPDHIATYLTGENVVVPLDALISDPKYGLGGSEVRFDAPTQAEIIPQFLTECKINGTTYALPYMRSTEACYVNKTYVEALGFTLPETLTWDFIWEVSAAATAKNADGTYVINGQNVMIPFIYKSTDNMMIQMLKQQNAPYSKASGEIGIWNEATKEILMDVAESTKLGAFSTFKISSYPGNFFNAGQCIFAIDSTAGATWIGPDAPLIDISKDDLANFETVVMKIPQYDVQNPKMISQGPSMCIFNKTDPQIVLASWLFTQFLLTNEVQISYAKTEGYIPVTSKAQNDPVYVDYLAREGEDNDEHYKVKIQASKLLLNNIENTFVTPVFNGSTSLRNAAGYLIEEVTKAIRRKKTVDNTYLDSLYQKAVSLYHLDRIEINKDAIEPEPPAEDGGQIESEAPLENGSNAGDKNETNVTPEPLPTASVVLLATIGVIWIGIVGYVVFEKLRKRKSP